MPTIAEIIERLERIAPVALAEEWDNVGLLVGDRTRDARRVMTCLTLTDATADEAVDERVDLVVVHHPLPFHALKRITTDTHSGRLLWRLIGVHASVYSAHTAFDSAAAGINQQLAAALALDEVRPIVESSAAAAEGAAVGAGRCGRLAAPAPLGGLAARLKTLLNVSAVQIVGSPDRAIERVAVACGSAGEFLAPAHAAGCDCLVTGETRFHTCLEAEGLGVALALVGHYASERFALDALAQSLARELPAVDVWASRRERDPLSWI